MGSQHSSDLKNSDTGRFFGQIERFLCRCQPSSDLRISGTGRFLIKLSVFLWGCQTGDTRNETERALSLFRLPWLPWIQGSLNKAGFDQIERFFVGDAKPGDTRNETGRHPGWNRATPGMKPGDTRDGTGRHPGRSTPSVYTQTSQLVNYLFFIFGQARGLSFLSFVSFLRSIPGGAN